MRAIAASSATGGWVKWNGSRGTKGIMIAAMAMARVVASRYLLGLLLLMGRLVRMTRTTTLADMTDSMNQPVLNSVSLLWKTRMSTPKVRKSKIELIGPKVAMKFRMKLTFQR